MEKLTVKKPWGKFEQFTLNEISTVKILTVTAGEQLSYQVHKKRKEFWRVIEGEGYIIFNDEKIPLNLDDEQIINPGDKHALGSETGIKVLEISFGEFDEEDIIRLEDKYGRANDA